MWMINWKYGTGDFLVLYLVAGTALFPQMLCEFCLGSPREQGGSWNEEDYPETDLLLFFFYRKPAAGFEFMAENHV